MISLSRRSLLKAGAAAGALAMPAVARAKPDHIVVATPGGVMDDAFEAAYFAPFKAKTGISVVKTTNQYAKLKAMVDAGSVEWDAMDCSGEQAAVFSQQNLLEPFDWSMIDQNGLLPGTVNPNFTLVDIVAGVVAWNTSRVGAAAAPKTWAEVWDLKRFQGDRMFWKKPSQTFEAALLADGVAPDKLYPLDVARALKSLDKLKGHISWWESGAQSAQLLIDGEAAAGYAWNGRLAGPKANGAPVDFTFNQAMFLADAIVIPRGAKNKRESMELIAVMLDPENQANFAKRVPYGPVRSKAMDLLEPARRAMMPTAPENFSRGTLVNGEWWAKNGVDAAEKFNSWMLS
ncbi:MAG: ABC transporter substrate-binding protein [Proteobacteria bacterium]|nr:ABC transporter substrate-binding protein [Pseudomonadota bacterium]